MPTLKDLQPDALKLAHDSATRLIDHKAYLPPGGLLVMLLGRWRDDIREVLGRWTVEDARKPQELPRRGRERHSLDELTSIELDTVAGAVMILLQDRFTALMPDPALARLLGEFQDALNEQKKERAELRASKAS